MAAETKNDTALAFTIAYINAMVNASAVNIADEIITKLTSTKF
jgi:hypothetical protein